MVKNDTEINADVVWEIRKKTGLSQSEFWGQLGVIQSCGSTYESNIRPIPRSVKALIFIRYIAGINIDTSTDEGAKKALSLAKDIKKEI